MAEIIVSERTTEHFVEEVEIETSASGETEQISETVRKQILPAAPRPIFAPRRLAFFAAAGVLLTAAIGYAAYKFFGFAQTEFETGKLILLTSTEKTKLAAVQRLLYSKI